MQKSICVFFSLILSFGGMFAQQKYTDSWESIDNRPVPKWFTDAKFGIFIHWGLYSVPAWGPLPKDGTKGVYESYSEHYLSRLESKHPLFTRFHETTYGKQKTYQDFVTDFKCEMFDPDEWAKLFQDAGARYVVLTSKHHDGFALWPSLYSWNWNASDVGPHRDLLGDLTAAVKKTGLHMGYYYSLLEWLNPLYKDIDKYVTDHMIPQMKELVTRYEPDIFWPDGEWDYPSDRLKSTQFLAWLYNESPVRETVVVNDRWGKETRSKHGGFYTTEYDLIHSGNVKGTRIHHPWEECRGIGHSFGYNRNESLDDYSTSAELVHLLVEKVALGGNLLLNIGPTADGRIPVIMQQRLTDIGQWLKINGEAIYETTAWDDAVNQAGIFYTTKGKDLYVICTQYPVQPVVVKNVGKKPSSVGMLGSGTKVKYSHAGKDVTITPPVLTPATIPCDHAWVFKLSGCL
ncbi:MAG: alpha-L-fucosidase [Bacteroidales bacterium]|jgi:alpha-L-fucosidase|nr:alpha-L-fucosidase [Bacteroidales bacterium]